MFLYIAGSNFFDLQSKKSDLDFKGIYLPSPEKFYKNKDLFKVISYNTNTKNTKNTNEDIDLSLVPLPFFFELLKKGDFNMIELLNTPKDKILLTTNLMDDIFKIKEKLLLRNIKTFIGFFNKEYTKYSINIHHHKHRVDFVNFLNSLNLDNGIRLKNHWDSIVKYSLNKNNGLNITKSKTGSNNEHPTIEIGLRKFQWGSKISYVTKELAKSIKEAGNRQKNIVEKGQDLKGLYHCLRLLYEGEDLLTKGNIEIPISKKRHDLLYKIKNNKIEENEASKIVMEQLKKVQSIEENCISNQDEINFRIDKILFVLQGIMEIEYLLNGEGK